jgi:hypothetical protein
LTGSINSSLANVTRMVPQQNSLDWKCWNNVERKSTSFYQFHHQCAMNTPWPHMPNLIQLVQGTEPVLPTIIRHQREAVSAIPRNTQHE